MANWSEIGLPAVKPWQMIREPFAVFTRIVDEQTLQNRNENRIALSSHFLGLFYFFSEPSSGPISSFKYLGTAVDLNEVNVL